MKILLQIFVLIIICGINAPARSLAGKTQVIVYALEDYPPYSYLKEGKIDGAHTAILKAVFQRMDEYDVTIQPVPWIRGLKYLESGSGFALYPLYHRRSMRPYIWPYSLPLMGETVAVYCIDDVYSKQLRHHWPNDYFGLTVGNNLGYAYGGESFWSAVKKGNIIVEEVKTTRQNLLKLISKRIDCYMSERSTFTWQLNVLIEQNLYDKAKGVRLVEASEISFEQVFLGFTNKDNGRFSYKKDFHQKFNSILYSMKKAGEIEVVVKSYIP